MTKKRLKKKSQDSTPALNPHGTESLMADLGKLLSQQQFASIDEVNAFMQELLASGKPIPQHPATQPLDKAQDLIYQAWESSGKKRIELAKRALEISPDCADAYVLLAEESAASLEEAKALYEKGVETGKRAIGEKTFHEDVGHFWGILETRPYMRARVGLAQCLWLLGNKNQAVEHYRDMLRLNPNDNQGIRYLLLNCLMEMGNDADVLELLKQYDDDAAANWTYSWALYLFRAQGAGAAALQRLEEAIHWNEFVPAYLTGKKRLPKRQPPYITLGGEDEAQEYAFDAKSLWQTTPGALEWLQRVASESNTRKEQ